MVYRYFATLPIDERALLATVDESSAFAELFLSFSPEFINVSAALPIDEGGGANGN